MKLKLIRSYKVQEEQVGKRLHAHVSTRNVHYMKQSVFFILVRELADMVYELHVPSMVVQVATK